LLELKMLRYIEHINFQYSLDTTSVRFILRLPAAM
jgi:hypothetical protein